MEPPPPPSVTASPTNTLLTAAIVAASYWLLRRLATLLTADADVPTAGTPPAGRTGLSNRVVWVTGASSGIGAATAEAVVAAGGRVVLTARRGELLTAAADRLGGSSKVVVADVADIAAAPATVAAAVAAFGTVDVLINNAGVSTRETGAALGAAAIDTVVGVNFTGPIALSRELLAVWAAERRGEGSTPSPAAASVLAAHRRTVRPTLMFVSSVAAVLHVPLRSAYCGAKAALVAWANVVRLEEPTTRVVNVLPGSVRTGLGITALTATGTYGVTDRRLAAGLPPSRVAERMVAVLADEAGGVEEVWLGHKWPELALLYVATYARPLWGAVARRLAGRYQRELQEDGAAARSTS